MNLFGFQLGSCRLVNHQRQIAIGRTLRVKLPIVDVDGDLACGGKGLNVGKGDDDFTGDGAIVLG